MTRTLPRVAIAGATGNLGPLILRNLLDAGHHVTVLSRIGGNSKRVQKHPNIRIEEVDFKSAESMTPILLGVEVVISCVTRAAICNQNPLIDASVAAGVQRFIPAEFGMDSCNDLCIQLPICAPKADTQQYLIEKCKENPNFTWTGVANGHFLDWFIEEGLSMNTSERTAILYNGGDVPNSATTLADIAKAVMGILDHRTETENRLVYIQSALVTQNQLIQYAKDKDGKQWNTVVKDTEEIRQECFAEMTKGPEADVDAAMLGFCFIGCFTTEYGCDYSGHLDNKLLGIKEMSEDQLRELVEQFL